MADDLIVAQLPLFPDSLLPPKLARKWPDLHTFWQRLDRLPECCQRQLEIPMATTRNAHGWIRVTRCWDSWVLAEHTPAEPLCFAGAPFRRATGSRAGAFRRAE